MMKHFSSLIIGHITTDYNTDYTGSTVKQAGGAVLYSSAAAYAMGHNAAALTKVAPKDRERLSEFTLPEENIFCLDSENSTDMVNVYYTPDRETRKSVCSSQGDMFFPSDIPDCIEADIFHLAGLVYRDFSDSMIPSLSKLGRVAVDVQGYLRHVDSDNEGRMFFEDWKEKKELLPFIDFLKTDAREAEILTGTTDREKAAKMLHKWGAREILITHNTEVLVYDSSRIYTCPVKARNLSGRTGRGDTTFAVYVNERLTRSPEEALLTATAAVSLKMETPGPFRGSREQVEQYIKKFY